MISDKISKISYRRSGMSVNSWMQEVFIEDLVDARLGFGLEDTVVNETDMVPALKLTEE